ncbi:MAG: LysR family transcriptional regulator [Coriobacteriia bacterium]|nr:LysR family transcriptional regulator [Coriobacteriia bacterium]MBS5477068.1 LysR family transcriptional regulator [Coriobacteriia bacterium]
MGSRQLRYVTHVARTGSVSQTARELFISRQAISKALLSLERELGFEIFDREGGMAPTPEGAAVLGHMASPRRIRRNRAVRALTQATRPTGRRPNPLRRIQVVSSGLPVLSRGQPSI